MGNVKYRRRGTVIFETNNGVLLVAGRHGSFILPGGGANKGESRFVAALRELTKETSLLPYEARVIFKHLGHLKPTFSGKGQYQDHHTVCVVKATGKIKLRDDAKRLAYIDPNSLKVFDPFNPGKEILISNTTKAIIQKYRNWKSTQQEAATDEDSGEEQDINSSDILPNDDVD
jgi:ADP-ribose pyrophosphatase YjhB (NUDIX family)